MCSIIEARSKSLYDGLIPISAPCTKPAFDTSLATLTGDTWHKIHLRK